ncbi:iron ABC transporter permease, partial [Myxococcota bacterium]|nr:iron ABC transporter permease [Myxococcota bacterium]
MQRSPRQPILVLTGGVIFLLAALALGLSVGTTKIVPLGGLFDDASRWIFHIRAPRVFLAALLGATLAMSGAALQGLLRNPLVSPYTIGVSSGSSLGAVIALRFGMEGIFGSLLGLFPMALAGGMFSMLLLFALSRRSRQWTGTTLLLSGITISFFCSAMIMFIQYTATYQESFKMVRWL